MKNSAIGLIEILGLLLLATNGCGNSGSLALNLKSVASEESGLTHLINSEPERLGTLNYPWMSPLVDINGDDHLDILYYGHHGGGAAVWLGNGDGTFDFDDKGYQARWVFGARDPIWWDWDCDGVMDAIGTEGSGIKGYFFRNIGSGHFKRTNLQFSGMIIDLDDNRYEEGWSYGSLVETIKPRLTQWSKFLPQTIKFNKATTAEAIVGWPEGVIRGRHPLDPHFLLAYSIDLNGDHLNELIFLFGGGRSGPKLFTWVLFKKPGTGGFLGWYDATADRGLPVGQDHSFFPEDLDVDGDLDIIDLRQGKWYENDGKGFFKESKARIFNPKTRLGKGSPWDGDGEFELLDLDNNGYRDLVFGGCHHRSNGVFLNLGPNGFKEVSHKAINKSRRNRKFGDVDHDGDIDVVRINGHEVTLYSNHTKYGGLSINAIPISINEANLGTKVWVYEAGGIDQQEKLIHYRQGFMQRSPSRSNVLSTKLHIGIGDHSAVDVRVRFPSGVEEIRYGLKPGTSTLIREISQNVATESEI